MSEAPFMSSSRIAVVTGGNRGIGLAIAAELVARGLRVIATSRDAGEGERAARSIGAESHALDVTSNASVDALAKDLAGGVDVIVNNAGIALDGFDAQIARRTVDTNFFGAVRVTDRLLPLARPGGRIVMISSGLGSLSSLGEALRDRFSAPDLSRNDLTLLVEAFVRDVGAGDHEKKGFPSSAYGVSKIAMNAFTRIVAREIAADPRRILINAACPGWVRTRMGGTGAPRSPEDGAKTPVWLALLPEGGPQGGVFRDEEQIPF